MKELNEISNTVKINTIGSDLVSALSDLVILQVDNDILQPNKTKNISTNAAELEAILDLARAGDSGSTTLDGSEQTIYEETDTTAFMLNDFCVDLSNQAGGDTVIIRIYKKIKSGGGYIQITDDAVYVYAGVQDPEGINFIGPWCSIYGIKVTIEHTVVAAAFDVDAEFNDSKAGG